MTSATLDAFRQSIAQHRGDDVFAPELDPAQWAVLATYLHAFTIDANQRLIVQGANDRALYFLAEGTLSVHRLGSEGQVRLAMLNPGTVVGEGAFFARRPRSAMVDAMSACRLWRLTPLRFGELAERQSAIALAVTLAAAQVLARRQGSRSGRVATT